MLSVRRGGIILSCRGERKSLRIDQPITIAGEGAITINLIRETSKTMSSLILMVGGKPLPLHSILRSESLRRQVEIILNTPKRLKIARWIVRRRMEALIECLEALLLDGKPIIECLGKAAGSYSVQSLLAVEANATIEYYQQLRRRIPSTYEFIERTRRPPRDPVSSSLNYGNAILYKKCHQAILEEGLDPRVGFLHNPYRNRASLTLDLADIFKPLVVDRAVIPLFTSKTMKPGLHYKMKDGETLLTGKGKMKILKAIRLRLKRSREKQSIWREIKLEANRIRKYVWGEADIR